MTFVVSEETPVGVSQFIYNFGVIFAALSHESTQDDTPSGQHFPRSQQLRLIRSIIHFKRFSCLPLNMLVS